MFPWCECCIFIHIIRLNKTIGYEPHVTIQKTCSLARSLWNGCNFRECFIILKYSEIKSQVEDINGIGNMRRGCWKRYYSKRVHSEQTMISYILCLLEMTKHSPDSPLHLFHVVSCRSLLRDMILILNRNFVRIRQPSTIFVTEHVTLISSGL